MAWETRRNQRYYYRSVRNGKKVKKIYFGCGPAAELAACTFDLGRRRRRADREAEQRRRQQYLAATATVDRLSEEVTTAMAAALSGAGYYEHGGTWRIRSNEKEESEMIPLQVNGKSVHDGAKVESMQAKLESLRDRAKATAPKGQATVEGEARPEPRADQRPGGEAPPNDKPTGNGEFRLIVERANGGDAEAKTRLNEILDDNPEVWKKVGDLAAHARLTLIRMIANGNQLLFDSLQRSAEQMEADLLGDEPTALERMLTERVIACWLQLQHADTVSVAANDNLNQAKFWSQERDRAHRRYLSAVKALTTTRQLLPANRATRKVRRQSHEAGQQMPNRNGSDQNEKPRSDVSNGADVGAKPTKERAGAAKATDEGPTNGSAPKSMNGHAANRILPFAESVAAK